MKGLARVPSGVIFDLDGTLTKPVHDFKKLRHDLHQQFPERNFLKEDVLTVIEKMSGESKKEAEDIVHRFEEAGRDLFEWVPGALDVLKYLDGKNIPRAIITRNSQISIDLLNEHLEIAKIPFFDINLGREFLPCKPAPDPALHIIQKWSIKDPKSCFFVGDGFYDMKCAKDAGCTAVLIINDHENVNFTAHHNESLEKGLHDHKYHSLADFQNDLMDVFSKF